MAIQKNKIPTPTEIKSSPTSFTEEELKELNRERFRAAARAAKRTKDNRKEDLDENNN